MSFNFLAFHGFNILTCQINSLSQGGAQRGGTSCCTGTHAWRSQQVKHSTACAHMQQLERSFLLWGRRSPIARFPARFQEEEGKAVHGWDVLAGSLLDQVPRVLGPPCSPTPDHLPWTLQAILDPWPPENVQICAWPLALARTAKSNWTEWPILGAVLAPHLFHAAHPL